MHSDESLVWLSSGTAPWPVVVSKWEETADFRLKLISQDSKLLLSDYFNQFPALKLECGYELLVSDFDKVLYPSKQYAFVMRISKLGLSIIDEARKRVTASKVKDVVKGIDEVLALLDPTKVDITDTDVVSIVGLCLLPYMMNMTPSQRKTSRSKAHSFDRSARRDSFITHIKSEDEIGTTIITRKEIYAALGENSLQPYIIAVGENLLSITKAVIVIEDIQYVINSLLDAVDVLFKIFQATNTCYPEESNDVWLFIQKGVYKISTKSDIVNKSVRNLLDLARIDDI